MISRFWALLCALAVVLCMQSPAQAQPKEATPAEKLSAAKTAFDSAVGEQKAADDDVIRLEKELATAKKKAGEKAQVVKTKEADVTTAKKLVVDDAVSRLKDLRSRRDTLKAERPGDGQLKNFERLIEGVTKEIVDNGGTVPTEVVLVPPVKKSNDDPVVSKKPEVVTKPEVAKVEPKAPFAGAPLFRKAGSSWEQKQHLVRWSVDPYGRPYDQKYEPEVTDSKGYDDEAKILDGRYLPKGTYYVLDKVRFKWHVGDASWKAGWYETSGEDAAAAPKGTQHYYTGSCPTSAPTNNTPMETTLVAGSFCSSCVVAQPSPRSATPTATVGGFVQRAPQNVVQWNQQTQQRPRLIERLLPRLAAPSVVMPSSCQPGMPCYGQ